MFMKMFAKFVPFMLVTAMSVFTACGGDSSNNADPDEPVSSSAVKKSSSSKAKSSSSVKSSSSTKKSSSSAKSSSATSNGGKATYDEKNNTMKDPRDNKTYKTVKIGNQVWMAENLNLNTNSSYCYGEEPSSKQNRNPGLCNTYGRLYKWDVATQVCPGGWHLPSKTEFEILLKTVGGQDSAGIKLKSVDGWKFEKKETVGTDDYGFTALPGGYRKEDNLSGVVVTGNIESYDFIGDKVLAYFWTSTEDIKTSTRLSDGGILLDHAFSLFMKNVYADAVFIGEYMDNAMSVRCVLGSDPSSDAKSSSSKKIESSSSVKLSSGSVAVAKTCKTSKKDECVYGSLTDSRDKQTYKTVKIGDQVWMAENLNYEADDSYCYDDKASNCAQNGRLYTRKTAIEVCPEGWNLPTKEDFEILIAAAGGDSLAFEKLRSTSGWSYDKNGSDDYGFSALPSGERHVYLTEKGVYSGYNDKTLFWSSTEKWSSPTYLNDNNVYEYSYALRFTTDTLRLDLNGSYWGSVRCIQGTAPASSAKSSSSKKTESSSSVRSSSSANSGSSVTVAKACKTATEDKCVYGTLTDSRDEQTYKTVQIGDQWWMAENLNYETKNSYCYEDKSGNCDKYGRLYTWEVAKKACPTGWHLPDTTEIRTLYTAIGGDFTVEMTRISTAALSLMAASVWPDGNGTDAYGFSALPAGVRGVDGAYGYGGIYTFFWISTEKLYYMHLSYDEIFDALMGWDVSDEDYGYSVRCVKD